MVTSLSLSIMATRAGHGGSSTLLDKAKPVPAQKGPAPAQVPVGGSVPIQITPEVDGKQMPKQTIPAPVVPSPDQPLPPKK
jgi:hypothetical protein